MVAHSTDISRLLLLLFYSSIRLLLWVYRFGFPEGDTCSAFLDGFSIAQYGIICDRKVRRLGQVASAAVSFTVGEVTVYVGYLRILQGGGNIFQVLLRMASSKNAVRVDIGYIH